MSSRQTTEDTPKEIPDETPPFSGDEMRLAFPRPGKAVPAAVYHIFSSTSSNGRDALLRLSEAPIITLFESAPC